MLKTVLLTLAACTAAITPANAAITVTSVDGTDPYSGPAPTFDFDSATPEWDGSIFTDSLGSHRAQPFGSTGGYASVGIDADGGTNPGTFDLTGFGSITRLSFLWGSVDTYNTVEFQDELGNVLDSFTGGLDGIVPADGGQTSGASNRVVTFDISGFDSTALAKLVFTSGQNAFEFDNLSVVARVDDPVVPEPATWAMLITGFAMIGAASRINRQQRTAAA